MADVTYLFFRRDRDTDHGDTSPAIREARVSTHGGGRHRAGSVPPVNLRAASVPPPRSARAGSVAPSSRGAIAGGGTGNTSSSFSTGVHSRRGGTIAPQTIHRVTSDGTLMESTSYPASTSAGHHRVSTSGSVGGARTGHDLHDRRRRASLATTSLSPAELQQRSRTARETLIYRADDFQPAGSRSLGLPPPRAAVNGPLSVSVTSFSSADRTSPAMRSPITSGSSSVRLHGRRASVSGLPPSDYRRSTTTVTGNENDFGGTGSKGKSLTVNNAFENAVPSSKESLTGLRSRMNAAREQVSRHKMLMDRYLPFNSGPSYDVEHDVEYKVSELAERMPELDPNKRRLRAYREEHDNGSRPILLVTPYTPLPRVQKIEYSPLPPVKSSFTPKISDVRKRARSVLCKVKGDPRYFDL